MSSENILSLIGNEGDFQTPTSVDDESINLDLIASPTAHPLEIGEDHEWDELDDGQESPPQIGDVVNGLNFQQRALPHSGESSAAACLQAIFAMYPPAKEKFLILGRAFMKDRPDRPDPNTVNVHTTCTPHDMSLYKHEAPPIATQRTSLDAYFDHFHKFLPMVDEAKLRDDFLRQKRNDTAWTALSNVVLALGSIAAGDDNSHMLYYARAQGALGYNIFTSGNLEILQALILLSSMYLHYLNSPNTAYLVMGTAVRMGVAMGLHREWGKQNGRAQSSVDSARILARAELRRRTWWCLVCTDATQGLLLQRPRLVRWDLLTIDVALPSTTISPSSAPKPGFAGNMTMVSREKDFGVLLLGASVDFAKIAQKIGDRVSQLESITSGEVFSFDAQLRSWSSSHCMALSSGSTNVKDSKGLESIRNSQLLAARLLISRSHVLRLAVNEQAHNHFTADDWKVVLLCQDTAMEMVDLICSRPNRDRLAVWLATAVLFHACIVLLLSIATAAKLNLFSQTAIDKWKHSVEYAISACKDMLPYKRAVDKYGEVIEALHSSILEFEHSSQRRHDENHRSTTYSPDISRAPPLGWTDFLEYNMTAPDPFLEWFDYDFAFADDGSDWYPLPDS